jgi:hypothetical protein
VVGCQYYKSLVLEDMVKLLEDRGSSEFRGRQLERIATVPGIERPLLADSRSGRALGEKI